MISLYIKSNIETTWSAIEKPLMSTFNIRLYDIFRKSFNLSENDAKEAVQVIEEVYKDQAIIKHEHTVEIIHKDMHALKEHMDMKLGFLKEYMENRFATRDDVGQIRKEMAETKAEIIKWSFVFWIGTIITVLGGLFAILKLFFDK